MNRNEIIMKAIKNQNITPDIEEMMKQDIKEAELKRRKEIFNSRRLER
jgi:hypothetical protein